MNNNFYPQQPYQIPQASPKQYKRMMQKKEKHEILTAGFGLGATIIAYLFMQTLVSSWLNTSGYREIYDHSSMFQSYFNVIGVHIIAMLIPFSILAIIFKKRFQTQVIQTTKVSKAPFWAWVSFGMMVCYIANMFVAFIIALFKEFGYELKKFDSLSPSSTMDCIAIVIAVAIVPAIIEEISMRCIGLGILQKHGKGFAVFAISIVFGLLHGNIIQFVFAFCVGMVLGFITIRTNSVIPAMVVHGFNNGLSAVQDILKYASGTKVASMVVSAVYILWIIFGIIGTVYLISTKRLFARDKKAKNPYALNFFTKTIYFLPGMIIPLIILIMLSAQTIVKI